MDREERPDLDKIYQQAFQLLNSQGGGWPLTMFRSPDTATIFWRAYFPKNARYHPPGFVDLLMRINETFESKRKALRPRDKPSKAFEQLKIPVVILKSQTKNYSTCLDKTWENNTTANMVVSSAPSFQHLIKYQSCFYWAHERNNGAWTKTH